MILVARKNLFSERTRLAISAGGIALSVLLISLLLSLYRGWNDKVGGFVESVNADIWIAREGTTDFINAASILPASAEETLEEQPQVAEASPLIVRPMSIQSDGRTVDIHLVGYDPVTRIGGPLKIEDGKEVPGPDEIIVDEAMSRRFGVDIGDTIETSNKTLQVVGKSSGGDWRWPASPSTRLPWRRRASTAY
ncbi:MAG: ABC transporter permease [Chloroflexi bacterium]|nr:ABC transporter permease [Chloroflexota bacterium]